MNRTCILGIVSFLSLFPAAAFATDSHNPSGQNEAPTQYSNEGNKWAYEKMMNEMSGEKAAQNAPKVPHSNSEREESAFDNNNIFQDRKARTKSIAPW